VKPVTQVKRLAYPVAERGVVWAGQDSVTRESLWRRGACHDGSLPSGKAEPGGAPYGCVAHYSTVTLPRGPGQRVTAVSRSTRDSFSGLRTA
jgi:hypothetical protein